MEEDQYITQEGYDKLQRELNYLKNVRRHEISERIERAKELGDLSENAEYSEAKDEQAFNEGRIIKINDQLKKLVVVESKRSGDAVDLGSNVIVQCKGKEKEFDIVSFNEVDPENNKISNESPLGTALINRRKGEKIKIRIPKGEVEYEILKVD